MQRTALHPALVALHVKGSGWRSVGLTPMPVSSTACTQATSQSQPKADSRLDALAFARSGAASKALPLRQAGPEGCREPSSSNVLSQPTRTHHRHDAAFRAVLRLGEQEPEGARRHSALATTPPERPTN